MKYSNPEIPEGINVTPEHPLKEFFILLAGIIAVITVSVISLALLADRLAIYVPFSVEEELMAGTDFSTVQSNTLIEPYLQGLADQLRGHMQIPEDIHITLHYQEEDTENAYVTLGGHAIIYRGLMKLLSHENALALVLAHEMAHIKHRDPIIAMGRGVVIGLLLAGITGLSGDHFTGQVVSSTGVITLLTFNRDQERAADAAALTAVAAFYGHINGAGDLFKVLNQLEKDHPLHPPRFLSTHPLSQERIDSFHRLAKEQGWNSTGKLTEIPANIRQYLDESDG